MRTTTLALILGAGIGIGIGIDMFATSGRWPNRAHPRRDDEGHDSGDGGQTDQGTDSGGAGDAGDNKPDGDGKKTDDDEQLGENGKKALQAERARAKELEKKLAERDKADEKARLAKLDDQARAEAERDTEKTRADAAEARIKVMEAAIAHGITDKADLELLAGVPVEKVDDFAKRLAKPKGKDFGHEAGGDKPRDTNALPDGFLDKLGKARTGVTLY